MKHKRINIGLFITDIENDFDNAIARGVMSGVKELDANLIIFPGRTIRGDYQALEMVKYGYQYNTLFSYASSSNIDILLISFGAIATMLDDCEKKIFLDMFQDIPVILLASSFRDYPSITFDNKSGLRNGIETLILKKKLSKIGFVSGPVSNEDALERLAVYKETLEANGIAYDEDLVAYGNFSEFTEEIVTELMTKHPEIEGLVFANDQMAVGGYTALKMLGRNIGEDILVMGFDDSPMATTLIPNLTTVRADSEELGRVAVAEAINTLIQGRTRSKTIGTMLVERDSSGRRESTFAIDFMDDKFKQLATDNPDKAGRLVASFYIPDSSMSSEQSYFAGLCSQLFSEVFSMMAKYMNGENTNYSEVDDILSEILDTKIGYKLDFKRVLTIIGNVRDICLRHWPEKEAFVGNMVLRFSKKITVLYSSKSFVKNSEMKTLLHQTTSITRDMLTFEPYDDSSFCTVNEKLKKLGVNSVYLYAFNTPFVNCDASIWHDWQVPSSIKLKSYYNDLHSDVVYVEEKDQEISTSTLFTHKFMPSDRRYTYVLQNVFINEEQYGMLLCELADDQVYMLYPMIAELAAALKLIYMLKVQVGIQKQLESSLAKIKENNELLETISKKDELTGIYNRRGFFEKSAELVRKKSNSGKLAILIFADLDNLKLINDRLGHDDGDFALRATAEILQESMRASDIVARIGGDEFAALAITENKTCGDTIYNRIKECMVRFNENCDKPYYVGVSVGYAEFVCAEGVEIEKYLDDADGKLYVDKKKKRLNVMKSDD